MTKSMVRRALDRAIEDEKKLLIKKDRNIPKLQPYHTYSIANTKLRIYICKAEEYLDGVYGYARTGGDYRSYSLASLYGAYKNMIEVADRAMVKIREDLKEEYEYTFDEFVSDFYERDECDE